MSFNWPEAKELPGKQTLFMEGNLVSDCCPFTVGVLDSNSQLIDERFFPTFEDALKAFNDRSAGV